MNWVKFKAQAQLNKKCSAVKHTKIKGVPKLDDANDAGNKVWCAVKILKCFQPGCSFQDCWFISGGKNSTSCTLILTEGDSAKTLAVSGLGVVGRDRYGVFPLRGKMLNVREASHKQVRKFKNIVLTASWGCINYRPHNSIIIIIFVIFLQIMENAEINNVIKILGLQYKKNYSDLESLKSLRYGKLMIMTDQVRLHTVCLLQNIVCSLLYV